MSKIKEVLVNNEEVHVSMSDLFDGEDLDFQYEQYCQAVSKSKDETK